MENELNSLTVICNYGTEKDNIYFKLNKTINALKEKSSSNTTLATRDKG